jgi:hypothetical protein
VTADNPHGIWSPLVSNSTLVLHYAYTSPGDVAVKAGRICPTSVVEEALAGNINQVIEHHQIRMSSSLSAPSMLANDMGVLRDQHMTHSVSLAMGTMP